MEEERGGDGRRGLLLLGSWAGSAFFPRTPTHPTGSGTWRLRSDSEGTRSIFFVHRGYFNPFCQKILTMGFFTEEHRSFALLAASFVAGCGLLFSISGSWVGLASVFSLIHSCRPPGKPGGGPSQAAGRERPLLLPQSLLPNTGGGGSGGRPAGCTPGPCAGRPACWDHTAEPCPVHLHLRDHR